MKVLVINAGSSSLKYQLIDMETEGVIAKGICERIGIDGSQLVHKANGETTTIVRPMPDHTIAMRMVLDALVDEKLGVIKSMDEIGAVGHRLVSPGESFDKTVFITDEVIAALEKTIEFAPIHNPANILGMKACRSAMPNTPQAVVFDTAFHSTMPAEAKLYAIDYDDYKKYGVRRYGAHGTSHKFVSQEAAKFCNADPEHFKVVTCHLGGGSSVSAVKNGKCIDTSMGFTPLAGVCMGTRSGDIDPSAVKFLADKKGFTFEEAINYLNKKCGVLGVSGVSSDFRDLLAASEAGNERATLAIEMFCYQVKKYVGAYAAAMGGLDCIVFTAGVGENCGFVRTKVCKDLAFLGVEIDEEKNAQRAASVLDITKEGAKTKVLVIPTNEELVIARETLEVI